MSKRFHVDPNERVSVYEFDTTIDGAPMNCMVIRARMNVEIAGRVQSEMARRNAANQTEGYVGVVSIALLLHNVLAWSGPDFDDLPCTPENICALPPPELDPFIEKVINTIGALNNRPKGPNPKPLAGSTSEKNGAAGLKANVNGSADSNAPQPSPRVPLETMTQRSPLRSALDGRRSRSEDSTPTT